MQTRVQTNHKINSRTIDITQLQDNLQIAKKIRVDTPILTLAHDFLKHIQCFARWDSPAANSHTRTR